MRQGLWKAILLGAIGVSVVSSLFVVFSPVKAAHAAPTRAANCIGQTIPQGQAFFGGQTLAAITTCGGNSLRLTYQTDGNLVLYCGTVPIWATDSNTILGSGYAIFQMDGNLVVYNPTAFGRQAVWASNTNNEGANRLGLQGDANLVIYAGSTALWASNTAAHC